MPIFGFHCESCGKDFETLVRASDTPACPGCESTRLERQLSRIAKPASGGPGAGAEPACAMPSGGHMCGGPGCCMVPSGAGCG